MPPFAQPQKRCRLAPPGNRAKFKQVFTQITRCFQILYFQGAQFNGAVGLRRALSCLNSRSFLDFPLNRARGIGGGRKRNMGHYLAAAGSFHYRRTRRRPKWWLVAEAG